MMDDLDLGVATDESGGEAPFIVGGRYFVTCVGFEDAGKSKFPRTDKNGEPLIDPDGNPVFNERWKWVLHVDDVDSSRPNKAQQALVGQDIWHWTNKGMGPKSYTRAMVEALIRRPLNVGERVKKSWLIGQRAIATLTAHDDGKIKSCTLEASDWDYQDDGPPPEQVERMAQQAGGDSREKIMQDLHDLNDRRDLAPILTRMSNLGLSDDDEVKSIYHITFSRLAGAKNHPQRARTQQQPSLVS